MKFRYLIIYLFDGSVVGVNKELSQEELDDDYLTIIDTATCQVYNPTSSEWQTIVEPTAVAVSNKEAGKELL
jgi:hypothetical protein